MSIDTSAAEIARRMIAIGRVIAAKAGCQDSALRAFSACIAPLEGSCWPDMAWRVSRLTGDGGPIEVVFSSAGDALRYTIEVAGPEVPESLRLDAACERIASLNQPAPAPELVRKWRQMQAGLTLRWGAWLGLRCDSAGERAKVYVEVPLAASNKMSTAVGAGVPGSRLRMIGCEPARGRIEYYFSKAPLERWDLDRLLGLVESPNERQKLRDGFAEVCGMPIEAVLQRTAPGYSLAWGDGTDRPQLALFVRAKAVSGGAQAVRRIMLRHERQSSSSYRALVAPIPHQELPDHGIVTVGLGADGELEVRVGLSGVALAQRFAAASDQSEQPRHPHHAQPCV